MTQSERSSHQTGSPCRAVLCLAAMLGPREHAPTAQIYSLSTTCHRGFKCESSIHRALLSSLNCTERCGKPHLLHRTGHASDQHSILEMWDTSIFIPPDILTLILSLLSISPLSPYQANSTNPNIGRAVRANVPWLHDFLCSMLALQGSCPASKSNPPLAALPD
jgi:hypothetical protein